MDDNTQVLIDEGEYELAYECHETTYYMGGSPKVTVWLKIIDQSEHYSIILPRYYNAKSLIDGPAVGGLFTVGINSDCAHEFAWIEDKRINPNHVTLEEYQNKTIIGEVKTVTKRYDKSECHPCMQYSKIARLLRAGSL